MTHICISDLTIIGSDNGLSPGRRQAIIWTNAGILLIRPLGTNFSEILSEIHTFSFKKMHLKTSSAKWRPFCLGLNVLRIEVPSSVVDVSHVTHAGLHPKEESNGRVWYMRAWFLFTWINLCMRPANERQHYNVMPFLIGRAHSHIHKMIPVFMTTINRGLFSIYGWATSQPMRKALHM